jgi:hypothetical protein
MADDLIAEQIGEGGSERAVHLADRDLGLGCRAGGAARDQRLTNANAYASAHSGSPGIVRSF